MKNVVIIIYYHFLASKHYFIVYSCTYQNPLLACSLANKGWQWKTKSNSLVRGRKGKED